jgi:hypothetical protein
MLRHQSTEEIWHPHGRPCQLLWKRRIFLNLYMDILHHHPVLMLPDKDVCDNYLGCTGGNNFYTCCCLRVAVGEKAESKYLKRSHSKTRCGVARAHLN